MLFRSSIATQLAYLNSKIDTVETTLAYLRAEKDNLYSLCKHLRFDLDTVRFKAPHGLRKSGEPRSKPGPKGPRKNKEMKNV